MLILCCEEVLCSQDQNDDRFRQMDLGNDTRTHCFKSNDEYKTNECGITGKIGAFYSILRIMLMVDFEKAFYICMLCRPVTLHM